MQGAFQDFVRRRDDRPAPPLGEKDREQSVSSGGKGIRTPDIQLAKLALYQLSYAPASRSIVGRCFHIATAEGEGRSSEFAKNFQFGEKFAAQIP